MESTRIVTGPLRAYDPRYDPLTAPHPGRGTDYAPTYWVASAGQPPHDDGPISGDIDSDVVIVGSGFTGLATALMLAREHGIRATVLEANRSVWGCTSRNGGQGQNATGRLYRSQWVARWGKSMALRLDAEVREGFDTFKSLVTELPCDAQPGGHLLLAHRDHKLAWLTEEARLLREVFGYDTQILSRGEVAERYVNDADCCGAMHESEGIGVHPLKLAHGYLRAARSLGVKVHPASPVLEVETKSGVHHLRTPGGTVRTRAIGFCTGGYTSNGLHASLDDKIMPILSNSLVTRPLTESELVATGFKTKQAITDTRKLRNYYRRLPDNRVQIGSRSAITGADAPNPKHLAMLTSVLHRKFPALRDIQIDHSWWGWVDVSHDMMPRIAQPDTSESVFYALGYGGNGVAFSAHAGKRMAQRIAGAHSPAFDLPIYRSSLEFPNVFGLARAQRLAPFRRLGQRFLYHWYHLQDEVL